MNSLDQTSAVRRESTIKTWLKVFYVFLALLLGCEGLFLTALALSDRSSQPLFWLVGPALLFGGAYTGLYALRSRLVIEGTRITVRGAFGEKSADVSEIEGFRTVTTRNGSYRELRLKEGRGTITVASSFATDRDFSVWFAQLPDLDERDKAALLTEIGSDAELGSTPEERLAALGRAKQWAIVLLVTTIAAALGVAFAKGTLVEVAALALASLPLVGLVLALQSPLLYAVVKRKKDPRAEVGYLPMITGFGFLFYLRSVHLPSMHPLWTAIVAVGLALTISYVAVTRKNALPGAILTAVIFSAFYAWGVVEGANTLLDHSRATLYSVLVIGKHVSHGKSNTYYLQLVPWGPVGHPNNVSVSSSTYNAVNIGDQVCVGLHPGALRAPWFVVENCPAGTQ
jgi:hypothetical protein